MADFDWDAVNDEIDMRINSIKTPMTVTVEIVAVKQEDIERENKRLRSIAERRAERDALDAERKEREAKRAEIKRQEEELANKAKPKPSAKSLFEQERDDFIANFVRNIKAEDMKAGRGHLWIGRNRAGDRAPKLSKGEVDAQTKAMHAWRIHKKL